jgi:hypothetical protein
MSDVSSIFLNWFSYLIGNTISEDVGNTLLIETNQKMHSLSIASTTSILSNNKTKTKSKPKQNQNQN